MKTLSEMLDSVLNQTKFDCGRMEETTYGPTRWNYGSRPEETISPEELRDIIERGTWNAPDYNRAKSARVVCPNELISQMECQLRLDLRDYINPDTDLIGHAFPRMGMNGTMSSVLQPNGFYSIAVVSSVGDFARGLVRGAALIGVNKTFEFLSAWIEGQPVPYRTSALLNGVSVHESLISADGVRIDPLPWTSSELGPHLPKPKGVEATDFLGRTVVSIDTQASPPLFRPGSDGSRERVEATPIPSMDITAVCQALSLVSDRCVDIGFYWNDYGALANFTHSGNVPSWSFTSARLKIQMDVGWSVGTDLGSGATTLTPASDWTLNLAEERLHNTLNALLDSGSKTRTAVSRWIQSKDTAGRLPDRFIDLRIALEALYLQDFINEQSQEMRFRLSLLGAWHLGVDFADRSRIRKTLRDAYDAASSAVHTGSLEFNSRNQQLLEDAQALCREVILKLLDQGHPEDWGDIILGRE